MSRVRVTDREGASVRPEQEIGKQAMFPRSATSMDIMTEEKMILNFSPFKALEFIKSYKKLRLFCVLFFLTHLIG